MWTAMMNHNGPNHLGLWLRSQPPLLTEMVYHVHAAMVASQPRARYSMQQHGLSSIMMALITSDCGPGRQGSRVPRGRAAAAQDRAQLLDRVAPPGLAIVGESSVILLTSPLHPC